MSAVDLTPRPWDGRTRTVVREFTDRVAHGRYSIIKVELDCGHIEIAERGGYIRADASALCWSCPQRLGAR